MDRATNPDEATAKRSSDDELALVMSGGGARSAYQVGVLRGLARMYPDLHLPILTGVSAGAINQAYLASQQGNFDYKTDMLVKLWGGVRTEQVFTVGPLGLFTKVFYWAMRLVSGGHARWGKHGMVDMEPLRESLKWIMRAPDGVLEGINQNLANGSLGAIAITTSSYSSGRSVTWVQGRPMVGWDRDDRGSVECQLTLDHVLASAALPLFFPAIRIGDDWYGDGGMGLAAPLAPAIHLGASRILAISVRHSGERKKPNAKARPKAFRYPPPAQVAGVLLRSIFLDQFEGDSLRLNGINTLLEGTPPEKRGGLRPIELVTIRPSQDLGRLANDYEPKLPGTFRYLERGIGTKATRSNDLLSMVMFQKDYARCLIEVGEADAERHSEELAHLVEG